MAFPDAAHSFVSTGHSPVSYVTMIYINPRTDPVTNSDKESRYGWMDEWIGSRGNNKVTGKNTKRAKPLCSNYYNQIA